MTFFGKTTRRAALIIALALGITPAMAEDGEAQGICTAGNQLVLDPATGVISCKPVPPAPELMFHPHSAERGAPLSFVVSVMDAFGAVHIKRTDLEDAERRVALLAEFGDIWIYPYGTNQPELSISVDILGDQLPVIDGATGAVVGKQYMLRNRALVTRMFPATPCPELTPSIAHHEAAYAVFCEAN